MITKSQYFLLGLSVLFLTFMLLDIFYLNSNSNLKLFCKNQPMKQEHRWTAGQNSLIEHYSESL